MRATFLCALIALVPMAVSAQAYKCKGADGKVSFQGEPCDEGAKGGPIYLPDPSPTAGQGAPVPQKAQTSSGTREKRHPGAPTGNGEDAALKERNRQLEADNRAMACTQARRNLSVLQVQRPVYSTDKAGNKVFVEDANRQAEVATAQRQVSESCK